MAWDTAPTITFTAPNILKVTYPAGLPSVSGVSKWDVAVIANVPGKWSQYDILKENVSSFSATEVTYTIPEEALGYQISFQKVCTGGDYYRPGSYAYYTIPTVPGAPTASSLSFTAPNTLSFSYTAASPMGSAVTAYEVLYATNPSFTGATTVANGTALSRTLAGLSIGTTYYVRARAQNTKGWGPYSDALNYAIPNVPSAPGSSALVFTAPNTLTFSYTAPANNGAAIVEYEISYANNSGFSSPTVISNGTALTRQISGLAIGTTQYFRVRARNSQGWGAYSTVVNKAIPNVPSQMAAPNLVYTPPSTVGVSFVAPANNGAAITEYSIQYADNASFVSPVSVSATASPKVISDLAPGKTYYFRVSAKNSQGWGTASPASSIFIYAGPRVRYGGVYRNTVSYVRQGGVWKVAIPYVRQGGVWKIAGG